MSPAATRRLGAAVARRVLDGTILGLRGPLGSGKSTFVRGFLGAFGIRSAPSPTFVLVRQHTLRRGPFRLLLHVDLYRLPSGQTKNDLGLSEAWGQSRTVTLVEWFDRLVRPPRGVVVIDFQHRRPGGRRISLPRELTPLGRGAAPGRPDRRSRRRPRRRARRGPSERPVGGR